MHSYKTVTKSSPDSFDARHKKTLSGILVTCKIPDSVFFAPTPVTMKKSVTDTDIFISHYLRQASAMTFSLRAMKSERALPFRRPLESRARSITCLRMSLPAAYSSTTA